MSYRKKIIILTLIWVVLIGGALLIWSYKSGKIRLFGSQITFDQNELYKDWKKGIGENIEYLENKIQLKYIPVQPFKDVASGLSIVTPDQLAISTVKDYGFNHIRFVPQWAQIEPKKGTFDFQALDTLVENAATNQITLLPVLLGIPRWNTTYANRTEQQVITDSHGTFNGKIFGASYTDGKSGKGLIFNDKNNYATLPEAVLNNKNALTVEFWVKSSGDHDAIISASNIKEFQEFVIYDQANLTIFVKGQYWESGIAINDGEWHKVNVSRKDSGVIDLYVDNALKGAQSLPTGTLNVAKGTGGWQTLDSTLVIGQEQDCAGGCFEENQAFNGILDELKIYNHDFSAQEPADNGLQFLVDYYSFDNDTTTNLNATSPCQSMVPPVNFDDWKYYAYILSKRYGVEGDFWVSNTNPDFQPGGNNYKPQQYWEVWNEENSEGAVCSIYGTVLKPGWWTGTQEQYLQLLTSAYEGIKSANPANNVVNGGIQSYAFNTNDGWLDKFLQMNGGSFFDSLALHPYPDVAEDNYVSLVESAKNLLAKYNLNKKIMVTEIGINQAKLNTTTELAETEKASRVIKYNVYAAYLGLPFNYWHQTFSSNGYGLFDTKLNPLPAANAYKTLNEQIGNYLSVSKISDSQYLFDLPNNKKIYVVWGNSPSDPHNIVKITSMLGENLPINMDLSQTIKDPIFIEK